MEKLSWTHSPSEGKVIGKLITNPKILAHVEILTATVMIRDSSKKQWRVRCSNANASLLMTFKIGQKLKLEGILGDLCPGAWDDAKRQIVPFKLKLVA